ncbi:hypothetical protein UMZ34_04045 [Halopseudomonas pachastrellae]|nr:hypothetical protein UMZ34_04045 [Halopseudomonas pachastrellae]
MATAAAEGALGVEIDLGMLGDLGEAEETEQPEEVAPPKPTPPPPPPPPPPPEPPRQQAQAQVREKPKPKPEPPREEEVAPEPAPEQPTANEAVEPGQSENRSQMSRSSVLAARRPPVAPAAPRPTTSRRSPPSWHATSAILRPRAAGVRKVSPR